MVGAKTDEDGMNQRPVAYVTEGKGAQPRWVDQLALPAHTFQSRATHCAWSDSKLFVLLQSDTQPQQTLSQTLLRVVALDPATGEVQAERDIELPGMFSAWVDEGTSHFRWKDHTLIMSGHDLSQSSPRVQTAFTVRMNSDLAPVEEKQHVR